MASVIGALGALLLLLSVPFALKHFTSASNATGPQRYTAIPGEEGAENLDAFEAYWNDRVTYPTGRFNPGWVRKAAAQDAKIQRRVPGGKKRGQTSSAGDSGSIAGTTTAAGGTNAGADVAAEGANPSLNTTSFVALGPKPLRMTGCSGCYDYGLTSGRVNDIVIDPVASNIAYAASVGGGVWKTTTCCSNATTWNVVTDDPLVNSTSIDTLALDPSNHDTIYAGTGDLNYGSFSMGSQGVLKSTNGGATWTVLGTDVFGPAYAEPAGQFPQYDAVGKVRVDPNNSDNVVAGTKKGLFFSYDAGANWTGPCTTNSFPTQRQDITSLNLTNLGAGVTRIVAAVGVRGYATPVQYDLGANGANGIYKATMPASGCPEFTSIAGNGNGFVFGTAVTGSPFTTGASLNAGSGAPYVNSTTGNQVGRIDIGVAPSDPDTMYAQVQSIAQNSNSGCGNANGCQLGVFATTNGGTSWTFMAGSAGGSLRNCSGGQGDYPQNWYDQAVAVDPNNADRVFISTFDVWLATRTGTSFLDVTCGYNGTSFANHVVHVDQHALAFVPGSSSTLLLGNDGGVHGAANANAAAPGTPATRPTWFNMDSGFNTIEFYSGDISGNFATSAAPQANGGSQDNGSMSVTFNGYPTGPVQWQMGAGGDGFYGRIDPLSNRMFQGNNSGRINRCTAANCTNSGSMFSVFSSSGMHSDQQSFILPYEVFKGNPGNPGGRPDTDCVTTGTPTCNHMIAGTIRVWETVNSYNGTSASWYANSPANLTKATLGNRSYINQLAYSPATWSLAIVGTNDGNVQIGRNMGTGSSQSIWTNVTDGNGALPNRPILDVAFDPRSMNTADKPAVGYAGVGGFNGNTPATPGHVFRVTCAVDCASFTWQDKTGNLPDVPVDSIIANPNFPQQVFAGTDFGLYFTDNITAASPTWFKFENGIPSAMIWDMSIDRGATTLSVWTRSRGAYVWPLPLGPLDPANRLEQTITFPAIAAKVYGAADVDPGATASSGLAVTYSAVGDCTIVSNKVHIVAAGSCDVTASQGGNVTYKPALDVTRTFAIGKAMLTVTASGTRQYSDPDPTFTPSITGFVNGEGASVLITAPTCTSTATASSGPGQYPVTCSGGVAANYDFTYQPGTLTVTQEDARATYNGNSLFWTSSVNSDSATVALSAAIQDITAVDSTQDAFAGDIRNATATFVDRATNTPLAGCANLPVGLANAGDTKTGLASCSTVISLGNGNQTGGDQVTIGIIVGGWYSRNDSADDTIVTIAQPIPSNFVTGAGSLLLSTPAGLIGDTAGTRSNVGLNVKYNKNGTNLQGNAMVIVRSEGRVYRIKANALSSLGVVDNWANFTGKAGIQDVTDPANPVSVDGNATLQLWLTDNGEPGFLDTIGIQVVNKNGGLWFSSNWSGTSTVEQLLAGGNLSVR